MLIHIGAFTKAVGDCYGSKFSCYGDKQVARVDAGTNSFGVGWQLDKCEVRLVNVDARSGHIRNP